jgi:hypothetical protein
MIYIAVYRLSYMGSLFYIESSFIISVFMYLLNYGWKIRVLDRGIKVYYNINGNIMMRQSLVILYAMFQIFINSMRRLTSLPDAVNL